MKVLFSCSESKNAVNPLEPLNSHSFEFESLHHNRKLLLKLYQDKINSLDDASLKALFGITKDILLEEYKRLDIFKDGTNKAVELYDGVGYKYLDYASLDYDSQFFVDNNVIIFSNLFGPILAKDTIPLYKLKQGMRIDDIQIDKFYKEHSKECLDEFIGDDLIVDLRAGYYEGFYDINDKYHIKIKFLKDGKMVSHYSKAFRGVFLRAMSQKEKLRDIHHLLTMHIPQMRYLDISENGKETTIIFEIIE